MIDSYKPIADRILIKIDTSEQKTSGGIYLPTSENDNVSRAEVIATGPGRFLSSGYLVAPQVQRGDRVIINSFAGIEIENGIRIIKEDDILIKIL